MAREADFTQKTKDLLAGKVGFCCSAPFCRKPTIGANADMSGTISIGEAAHITAAEPGGPRYDPLLTREQRRDEKNGIWLCRNHAAMIDRDETFFSVALLRKWKINAEREANGRIQGISAEIVSYTLRILYDDLNSCYKAIEFLKKIDRDVVMSPDQFPVTTNFEEKIETIVDSIGLDYASRMRNCFREISAFRNVLDVENKRFRNRIGIIADVRAVRYGQTLKTFLYNMEEFDIKELVSKIGKLFDEADKKADTT